MEKVKVISAAEAAALVKDNDTITTSGFVASALAEELTGALEERFLQTGTPKNLTLIYAGSQGNRDGRGGDRFAHEGFLKRAIIGHWNTAAALVKMAVDNKIEAYNIPQGTLLHLFRAIAGHKAGVITNVGLETFVDPRNSGGRLNARTTEDMVEVVTLGGEEQLFYKSFPINIAFIRGTYADEYGNISFEKEIAPLEGTSVAQAVKNSGGIVIVQVERIVAGGTLDPRFVKVPGILVDAIVVAEPKNQRQSLDCPFDAALSGELKISADNTEPAPLSIRKVIGRRAAMELTRGCVVNLGVGIPEFVAAVAEEESLADQITLTVESGAIGGVPQNGKRFGAAVNADCYWDQPYQFDFYDGGGLDMCFLGLAQCNASGDVNVSRFGPRIPGCGGFINISQNSKKVVFCGTFTAGGLKVDVSENGLHIIQEGCEKKFIKAVEEITFSGKYAVRHDQTVLFITERAVFELKSDGLHLKELAPGIDLKKDILDQMDFQPIIDAYISMPAALFKEAPMGLKIS